MKKNLKNIYLFVDNKDMLIETRAFAMSAKLNYG